MTQKQGGFDFLKALAQQPKATQVVAEKMSQAAFLGVRLQQNTYHIPVSRIREIIPNPSITPVGHTQDWLWGLVKVQGEVYSVVDISPLLDMPALSAREHFVVALSLPEGNYALLVSGVLGITKLSDLKQIDADDYTIVYQMSNKEKLSALSVQSIFESSALANMSIF